MRVGGAGHRRRGDKHKYASAADSRARPITRRMSSVGRSYGGEPSAAAAGGADLGGR